MSSWESVKEELNLMSLEDALVACFGSVASGDGEDEGYKVMCCGTDDVRYGSGIMGSDIAQCRKCGRKIVNVLSPHVSPILIKGSTTAAPPEEMIEALFETPWLVIIPDDLVQ